MSDLDEIPKPAALQFLRSCAGWPDHVALASTFNYYSFEWVNRGESPWVKGPKAAVWRGLDSMPAAQV